MWDLQARIDRENLANCLCRGIAFGLIAEVTHRPAKIGCGGKPFERIEVTRMLERIQSFALERRDFLIEQGTPSFFVEGQILRCYLASWFSFELEHFQCG